MNVILIVEDEILEQEFLESILLREITADDKIITCESGIQAIELAKRYKPNIIFMDLMISELDGLSAISQIREFLPNACISIISAYSDFSYAQKAISYRVFEYLLKPVKPTTLIDMFKRMTLTFKHTSTNSSKDIENKEEPQHVIQEAINFIDEYFTEKLTLEIVASKIFMNPKYFSHIFKKEMGVSFTEYIIQLRVKHACMLLKTTNYTAYRISSECGFSDASYFNRVFCNQMNMTPQSYRKSVTK